jgi:ELWxxDGT repeat protein/cysteine-rich repeat protein
VSPDSRGFVAVGSQIFFTGIGVWKSDGTAAGTLPVTNPFDVIPYELTNVGGRLFFTGYDDAFGRELWTSNGTRTGTTRLTDIAPEAVSAFADFSRTDIRTAAWDLFVEVNGTLVFPAADGSHGEELWALPLADVRRCGDAILDPSEECDDGNVHDGDCCSSACRLEPTGGTCVDDGDPCTVDACAAGRCTHVGTCDDPDECAVAGCDEGDACTVDGCDDGNPCTVDACAAGGCHHEPAVGLEAVRCLLPGAGLDSAECAGQRIPAAVVRGMERVRQLLDADPLDGKRVGRRAKRAVRIMKVVRRRLANANAVSGACAAAVSRLYSAVREATTLQHLVSGR